MDRYTLLRITAADGMPSKLSRCTIRPPRQNLGIVGVTHCIFKIRSSVRQGCALSPALINYISAWIPGQTLQGYPVVHVGKNVHASYFPYAVDIMLPRKNNYQEMQCLLEAANRRVACALTL